MFAVSKMLLVTSALTALAFFAAEPATPSFPTNEGMRHFGSLNAPRLSPDGHEVLVRIIDSTADGAKSHIWLIDIAKNTYRQLTYSPDSDKAGEIAAEWMPDGESILFLAHRGEHTQLYRLPMSGGEAKPYDLKILPPADASKLPAALPPSTSDTAKKEEKPESLPIDVSSFVVAPDRKAIAFLANDPKTPGEKKQNDAKADATFVDHEIHLTRAYLLDPANNKITSVVIPNDARHLAFSPDSSQLLVVSEEPNGASDLAPAAMIWVVKLTEPANPAKLPSIPASVQSAEWSSDGKFIWLFAQAEADTPPGYRGLFEYDLSEHTIKDRTPVFPGSLGFQSPIPLPDQSVFIPVNQGMVTTALRVKPGSTNFETFRFPTPTAGSFDTNAKHTGWIFLGSASTQPSTLYFTSDLQKAPTILPTPNIIPKNNKSAASKRITWKSDGLNIEGLLYLPPEAAERTVPLIVEVHGGPLGAYLDGYEPFVNFLVGHGWAVLRANPRGSSNYGSTFAAANKNDLGGGDYRDIIAGLDHVIKTEPIDPNKLALEGYSYGGEMAGFVEGKSSRFKAIISGAPVIDQYSEYGTETDSYYDRWYFGKPWEHAQDAWRQSPLSGVGHATTPFMLLQGDADTTDPLGQATEMYRALRQMGVDVQLITYPRENHGPLARGIFGAPVPEPWHGFDARQRIVSFLQKAFGESSK
jgi:dipeptidyl aminopeptidase/acylaminoacyl peptidase